MSSGASFPTKTVRSISMKTLFTTFSTRQTTSSELLAGKLSLKQSLKPIMGRVRKNTMYLTILAQSLPKVRPSKTKKTRKRAAKSIAAPSQTSKIPNLAAIKTGRLTAKMAMKVAIAGSQMSKKKTKSKLLTKNLGQMSSS